MSWERGSAFEVTQLGPEVVGGTKVAALKRLPAVSIGLDPVIPVTPFRPMGSMAATTGTHEKESCGGAIDGRLSFYDLCYIAAGCLCKPVISTPGGATNARRWNFKPRNWGGPDSVQSYSVERGQAAYAERALFMLVNSMVMRLNRTDASLTGTILAQEPDYTAHLSTSEVQRVNLGGATGGTFTLAFGVPVTGVQAFNVTAANLQTALEGLSTIGPGNVLVTAAGAGLYDVEFYGNLAQTNVAALVIDAALLTGATGPAVTTTTPGVAPTDIPEEVVDTDKVSVYVGPDVNTLSRLRRVSEVEFSIADRFAGVYELQDDEPSYSGVVQQGPALASQITMQRNTDAKQLIVYMRAKTTRIIRVEAIGPQIESGFNHYIRLTFPHKYRDPRHGSADSVENLQVEGFPVYDATFGGYMELEIQNAMTAL